jgi:NAD+ kinase
LTRIGIVANLRKPHVTNVATSIVRLVEQRGATVSVQDRLAALIGRDDLALPLESYPGKVDIVFVLGGDGTLLGVARRLAAHRIPLLGINLGHLGFLSESEPEDMEEAVSRVLKGNYYLEKRLMIEADVLRNGKRLKKYIALNDVNIGKGALGRMVTLQVYVDDMYLDQYVGDGLIVSTPTGSTAYSLSCGGPIVSPQINVILITPICPHTLSARPVVVSDEQQIRIEVSATHSDVGISIDGQEGMRLEDGDRVVVRESSHFTTLVKWRERGFFDVLRAKLSGNGADRRNGT